MINWYRGSERKISMLILTSNPASSNQSTTGDMFTGREEVQNNGSLLISNLRASDAGMYTVELTIPGSSIIASIELTVNGVTETPYPVTQVQPVSPAPHINSTASEPKATDNKVLIGVLVGSATAVFLVLAATIVYFKKYRKPVQAPVLDIQKPTLEKCPKLHHNEGRRLPSIPPHPPVYQNEDKHNEEHPYEDLAYVYLSSSYHDLHGPPRT
ncbi:uncharacterized protein [Pyxicephalus adspersus]|uniref:uncharacterized protein n=1 Tax=Pyxicephalus adspersus TaxID=30357 RepID=UPI003B5C6CDA